MCGSDALSIICYGFTAEFDEVRVAFDCIFRVDSATLALSYSSALRKRSELVITETELKLMAAAARIGLRSNPKNG